MKLRKKDRYTQNIHWGWKLNKEFFITLWFLFQNKLYGESTMKIIFSIKDIIPAFNTLLTLKFKTARKTGSNGKNHVIRYSKTSKILEKKFM